MRKLVLSMNITLDGFIAGPGNELDWHFENWTWEMTRYAWEQLQRADTLVLGRITYEAMARFWPLRAAGEQPADYRELQFAETMNSYTKVVFSRSLRAAVWENSLLVKKDLRSYIRNLKQQPGRNILLLGSGSVASALIRSDLVDEYILWIHPVILGAGKPLFGRAGRRSRLRLIETRIFQSGVAALCYVREKYNA